MSPPNPAPASPPSQTGESQNAAGPMATEVETSAGSMPSESQEAETAADVSQHSIVHAAPPTSVVAPGRTKMEGPGLIDIHDGRSTDTSTVPATTHDSAAQPASPEATTAKPAIETPDLMTSSVATLKPTTDTAAATASQYLRVEPREYVDPTPPTPAASQPPSRTPSNSAPRSRKGSTSSERSPTRSDVAYDEKHYASEDDQENNSRSEIQSIMEQFAGEGGGPGAEEVMSPRLELASPLLGSPVQHPPRKSSLEPLAPNIAQQLQDARAAKPSPTSSSLNLAGKEKTREDLGPPVPPKDASSASLVDDGKQKLTSEEDLPMSPSLSMHRPPPPEPEPDLPFDFHRFLEQLRNKKADPVARYLKSFLSEFGKRQWMVHEQVKIIGDFLAFIANKMAQCDVWRDVSDAEFDNAREGMEKLVMNRLYSQTFSPAIAPPQPIPGAKPKRRGGDRPLGPGRRGQHQEDVERDDVLAQKINIYGWVKEEHLDIPPVNDSGRRFLKLAQQELLKIKSYRAPRDKIICVLNCCKVIFGLLKHAKSDSSADSFMPMLIYVVLQSNPEHLVSNVQYILRFRNQEKLGGEAGYYLSSLMGVIQFIENMDRTTLTITDDEFEANVEAAVSAIAEKHQSALPVPPSSESEKQPGGLEPPSAGEPSSSSRASFDRPSLDADATLQPSTPRVSTSSHERPNSEESSGNDEKDAITGLLRSIQKPLSTIGRMFSEEAATASAAPSTTGPARTPQPEQEGDDASRKQRPVLSAEDAAARQASAEAAEAQRLHRAEHANVVETLAGMFPDLDREIISDVVYQKEGRVGLAVDACLALSA